MTVSATTPGNLEAFLCGDSNLPPLAQVRSSNLEAYAYTRLPNDHPAKVALKPAFLQARMRHQLIKQELLPLFAAWNQAGIEPLLEKGFYMAEFVYPTPGTRYHGDVDVCVPPDLALRALEIGGTLGWTLHARPFGNREPGSLNSQNTMLEVHRHHLANFLPWSQRERRITQMVWDHASKHHWEGVTIHTPSAVDAFLLLVLTRCWHEAHPRWRLKVPDLLDGVALIQRFNLDLAAVQARARQWRCEKTLELFLHRCDPFNRRLDLSPLPAPTVRQLEWAITPERGGHVGFEELIYGLITFIPPALRYALPYWQARKAIQPDLRTAVQATPLGPTEPTSRTALAWTEWGLRWAAKLMGGRERDQVVWAFSVFRELRRQGWPVVFCMGADETGASIAWVSLHGQPLPSFTESRDHLEQWTVGFQYPVPEAT